MFRSKEELIEQVDELGFENMRLREENARYEKQVEWLENRAVSYEDEIEGLKGQISEMYDEMRWG